MNVQSVRYPSAPLSRFVGLYWYKEARRVAWRQERLLPMGTVELVVNLSDPNGEPVLCGPHSQPFILENPGAATVIAVHFKPGGFYPFAGIPAFALHNQVLALSEVWGSGAAELRDRLLETADLDQRFSILERALLARSGGNFLVRPEVRYAMRALATPGQGVNGVVQKIGYSPRHFIEMFKSEVGLTPKAYSSVRRFQSIIAGVGDLPEVQWGQIALDAGYFDQAHFIHDFRNFSGLTPSAYLALRTSHLNHVPITD